MSQTDAGEGMRETRRVFCSAGGLLGEEGISGMHVKDNGPQKGSKTQEGDKTREDKFYGG